MNKNVLHWKFVTKFIRKNTENKKNEFETEGRKHSEKCVLRYIKLLATKSFVKKNEIFDKEKTYNLLYSNPLRRIPSIFQDYRFRWISNI